MSFPFGFITCITGYDKPYMCKNGNETFENKRATSYTTVNIDETVEEERRVEYFFASDARLYFISRT